MHPIELDDRVGFVPAFRRDGGAASHRIAEVARVGDAIDPLGLATILTLGFPLGTRTPIQGVKRLAPGEAVDARGAVVALAPLSPPAKAPSVDGQLELLLAASRRMLSVHGSDDLVAMLSGGRDSRMILLALRALGKSPSAILTVGRPGFVPDATVAQQLAQAVGCSVEPCIPAVYSLAAEFDRHRAQSLESLEHAWLSCLARHASRRAGGSPNITDGLGAGVLSTGSLMDSEAIELWRAGSLDALADWVVANAVGVGPAFFAAVARAGFPLASADEVRHALVEVFRELAVWPNPLGAFSLFHWSRRGISASPFGLLAAPGRVFAPLCDGALVEALLAMDIDEAAARDWREPVIERLAAGLPRVPFAEGAPRRTIASRIRRTASGVAWRWQRRSLDGRLSEVAYAAEQDEDAMRATFNRSAVGLLGALGSMIGDEPRPGESEASSAA